MTAGAIIEKGYYPITYTTHHLATDGLVLITIGSVSTNENKPAELFVASGIAGASTLGSASGSSSGSGPGSVTSSETIKATPQHPFWVQGRGWVNAGDLQPGDQLLSSDGRSLTVEATEVVSEQAQVYNFTVDQLHTYFVGRQQALVHNIDSNVSECAITLRFEQGMNERALRDKAQALQELADKGELRVLGQRVVRDRSVTANYKSNLIQKVYRQYSSNPEFRDKAIAKVRSMQPDHVHELQLSGPDTSENLKMLHAYTNERVGSQIWQQIRNLPGGTIINRIILDLGK